MNPRMGTLKETFEQFICDRVEKVGRESFGNPERNKMSDKISEVYKTIQEMLPPEGKMLLSKYEELSSEKESFIEVDVYRQGLKDGLELRKELGLSD
ncbi:MAG: hypothetical protein CVU89_03465 [Firmicutes bacterium HGW-Firmicutes-14]|jgi:tRNA-dihydrouridine synthase|nr:MAG: hypothetical protein CVU89_03465 [Firmicutes bacterium HGW-Firmicutes-14]